jgi:Protein of unknown function (DUF3631)
MTEEDESPAGQGGAEGSTQQQSDRQLNSSQKFQAQESSRGEHAPPKSSDQGGPVPSGDAELSALLHETVGAFRKHASLPEDAPEVLALWVIFTHTIGSFDVAPRLALVSPVPGCGKTTVLELLSLLVHDPLTTSNATSATIYRTLLNGSSTFLIDEADTFMDAQEALTGILNSGHKRAMAFVSRCVKRKDTFVAVRFPTFCAMAIARIGELPRTLESRSILNRMQRAAPDETLVRIKSQDCDALKRLRERIEKWAAKGWAGLKDCDPVLPKGMANRQADNWRPLLAIADVAGNGWPDVARLASTKLDQQSTTSPPERLIGEIKRVFDSNPGKPRFPSADLCNAVNAVSMADWKWTPQSLASALKPFGISPRAMRVDGKSVRGYEQTQFEEVWKRYLDHTTNPVDQE